MSDFLRAAWGRLDAPAVLRAGVFALAAPILCWPWGTGSGTWSAALAAGFAALLADSGQAPGGPLRRLRLLPLLGIAAGVAAAGALISALLLRLPLASWLGPSLTFRLSELALWGSAAAAVTFALRLCARRYRSAALFEVAAVAAAFATSLAAHRHGMVHRPLAIGDWAWSRGLDPTLVLLVLGGLCVVLLATLLMNEQRARRMPLHLAGLVAVALVLLVFVRLNGLPEPRVPAELGLTGQPQSAEGSRDSDAQDDTDDLELRDLPFRDEYASAGQRAPVAVVLLRDDYSPPSGVYYFRQSVFSQYNGRRLVQATRSDVDRDVVPTFPTERIEIAEVPPSSEHRRPLQTTVGLLIDHVRPFALDSPVELKPTQNPSPLRFQRTFDALSRVRTLAYEQMLGLSPGNQEWSAEVRQHYLEAPDDPRYKRLAAEVTADLREDYASDPLARALSVKLYLDEKGIYSRKSRHADQDDPAASFLFGDLTGYCVHFAHAATYLFRSLGIPARVAAGYAVSEEVRAGGSAILIQALNAHAWPEIYLGGAGWVVLDLAPQQVLDQFAPQPDPALQQMLADLLRGGKSYEAYQGAQRVETFDWIAALRSVALLLALAIVAAASIKLYRLWLPRYVGTADLHRVAYRAGLDRLAEVGLTRRYGESRETFAARAAAWTPSFVRLTDAHLRAVLGQPDPCDSRLEPAELRQLSHTLGSDLVQHAPRWRRWIGRGNPFSWWASR